MKQTVKTENVIKDKEDIDSKISSGREKNGMEVILEEVMTKNVLKLMKSVNTTYSRSQTNVKKNANNNKTAENKVKEKNFKAARDTK